MVRDAIKNHPLLAGVLLVPLTFVISLPVLFFALLLLDSLLIPIGIDGGAIVRVFVVPSVSIVGALGCSAYTALWLREWSQGLRG
jgi:hypothetical protein